LQDCLFLSRDGGEQGSEDDKTVEGSFHEVTLALQAIRKHAPNSTTFGGA
jgi:hypothetical protein